MTQETFNEKEDLDIVQLESEQKDNEITPLKYEISIVPADYTLEVLYQKWKNDEIRKEKLRTYYQKNKEIILERAREWNRKNKESRKLITGRNKKSKIQSFWQVNREGRHEH